MTDPLTDDGEAFRLAVELRLDIRFHPTFGVVCGDNSVTSDWFVEPLGDNPAAAVRRAIARASGGNK